MQAASHAEHTGPLHRINNRACVQLLNFAIMPNHLQIPTAAAISFVWTIILSMMRGKMDDCEQEPSSSGGKVRLRHLLRSWAGALAHVQGKCGSPALLVQSCMHELYKTERTSYKLSCSRAGGEAAGSSFSVGAFRAERVPWPVPDCSGVSAALRLCIACSGFSADYMRCTPMLYAGTVSADSVRVYARVGGELQCRSCAAAGAMHLCFVNRSAQQRPSVQSMARRRMPTARRTVYGGADASRRQVSTCCGMRQHVNSALSIGDARG